MTDTRLVLDCGHVAQPDGISTGWGETREGYRLCLKCCGEDETAMLPYAAEPYFAYLATDGKTVTGWPGNPLMTVTGKTESNLSRKLYISARDSHGVMWYGTGPNESGTYVTLRRYKTR